MNEVDSLLMVVSDVYWISTKRLLTSARVACGVASRFTELEGSCLVDAEERGAVAADEASEGVRAAPACRCIIERIPDDQEPQRVFL